MNNQKKTMFVGAAICVIGLLVTYLSYWFSKPGSTYTVASGAIVVGVYEMIMGLVQYLSELKKNGNDEEFRKWILIGIGALAAVAGLAVGGWKFVHKDDLKLLDEPQTIVCEKVPMTFTVPENFEEVDITSGEETNSTYAYDSYLGISSDRYILVYVTYNNHPDTVTVVDQIGGDIILNDFSYFNSSFIKEPEPLTIGENRVIRCVGIDPEHEDWIKVNYDMVNKGTGICASVTYLFNEGEEITLDQEKLDWSDDFIRGFSINKE